MSKRPEHENPPEVYYNDRAAHRYAHSSRIRTIQKKMTARAIELLQLPAGETCHILDVGCGSGLSGEVLASQGHSWVGMDISTSMLRIAKTREFESSDDDEDDTPMFGQLPLSSHEGGSDDEVEDVQEDEEDEEPKSEFCASKFAEVIAGDMGNGVPFRPGVFDGVISISAVQWLCYIDKKGHVPQRRLRTLFQSLYNCLRRGARAVIQFYPETPQQMNLVSQAAMKCGFGGGMVVDYPHSAKAKKYFLVLYAGQAGMQYHPPQPLTGSPDADYDDIDSAAEESDEEMSDEEAEYDDDEDDVRQDNADDRQKRIRTCGRQRPKHGAKRRRKDHRPETGSKDWVLMKKEERRKFGLKTTEDSKYTMRRRKPRF